MMTGSSGSNLLGNTAVAAGLSAASLGSNDSSRRLYTVNPYTHGARVDHHVGLPLYPDDAKTITRLCEERRVQILLNF